MRFALLVMLAACGHKSSDDCAIVRDDAEHAMERIAREYQGDPVKASEVIERCVAPTGDDCERVEKIARAIPKMIGSAALSGSSYASACRSAPPELRRCLLPSYMLAHADECKAALAKPIELTLKPGELPPHVVEDCGEIAVEIADDGVWIATSKDGMCFSPRTGDYDWAWLEAELRPSGNIYCAPSVELAATENVRYEDVIRAMDIAIKTKLLDVGLTDPDKLLVHFGGKAPLHCPPPKPIKAAIPEPAEPRPRSKSGSEALAQAPVIIVTKDAISYQGNVVVTIAQAERGTGVLPELAKLMPEEHAAMAILQADKDSSAKVINRIVTTAKSRGYDNVLFAVKNK